VRPEDFLHQVTDDDPDSWALVSTVLNIGLVEQLGKAPLDRVADVDAARALTRLVHRELEIYATQGTNTLDDDDIAIALRSLRAILRRLGAEFTPPFRDFGSFYRHWKRAGLSGTGSWAARRDYLDALFAPVLDKLDNIEAERAGTSHTTDIENRITEITRRRLLEGQDHLARQIMAAQAEADALVYTPDLTWSGGLDEVEFLSRLYDLDLLPSSDPRCATALEDIGRHRILNYDWDDDWVFRDERFGLATSDTKLLKFLALTLHPAARTDPLVVEHLHAFYNAALVHDGYEIVQVGEISGAPIFGHRTIGGGVSGDMKNLIFASIGPKPRIVVINAINNDFKITRNADKILIYDRPLSKASGLTWGHIVDWWRTQQQMPPTMSDFHVGYNLVERLAQAVAMTKSPGEELVFRTYYEQFFTRSDGPSYPALLPQVYLHLDPMTRKQRRQLREDDVVDFERMDFLLLLPQNVRVVLEVDGQHHYGLQDEQNPQRYIASVAQYAKMAKEDRALRLAGYEVYRFGALELTRDKAAAEQVICNFFNELFERHRIRSAGATPQSQRLSRRSG
jgi:very-short-patch-repair endonuclease